MPDIQYEDDQAAQSEIPYESEKNLQKTYEAVIVLQKDGSQISSLHKEKAQSLTKWMISLVSSLFKAFVGKAAIACI